MNTEDKAICRQVAHEVCATFLERTKKKMDLININTGCDYLVKWCLENNPDKGTMIKRQAALKRAVLFVGILNEEINSLKDVLELAKRNYDYYVRES